MIIVSILSKSAGTAREVLEKHLGELIANVEMNLIPSTEISFEGKSTVRFVAELAFQTPSLQKKAMDVLRCVESCECIEAPEQSSQRHERRFVPAAYAEKDDLVFPMD